MHQYFFMTNIEQSETNLSVIAMKKCQNVIDNIAPKRKNLNVIWNYSSHFLVKIENKTKKSIKTNFTFDCQYNTKELFINDVMKVGG